MRDPMGLLNDANEIEEEIKMSRSSFLLKEGDGLKLYDRIYKVTAIKEKGERIILKRVE